MSTKHGMLVVTISGSLAAAVPLVESYPYRGAIVRWAWSLTGLAPMPHDVSVSISIVLVTIILSLIGFSARGLRIAAGRIARTLFGRGRP